MNDLSKGRKGNKEAKKPKQAPAQPPAPGDALPSIPPAKAPRHRT